MTCLVGALVFVALVIAISTPTDDACKIPELGLFAAYSQTYLQYLYCMAIAGCYLMKPGKEGGAGIAAAGSP